MKKNTSSLISENRKARHNYEVLETFETGIALTGTEIKSLRAHTTNLNDSYALIKNLEVFVYAWHISPYAQGNRYNQDPLRVRKLLLHKREIKRLDLKIRQEALTLVPLKLYFKGSRAKLLLGLARGLKKYDKREIEAKKDAQKKIRASIVNAQRY